MSTGLITSLSMTPAVEKLQSKAVSASKDFEALLISQMLQSVREEGSGWLGTGEDEASDAAFGLGEQQLGRALTAGGGLGLSHVIEQGLQSQSTKANARPPIADQ